MSENIEQLQSKLEDLRWWREFWSGFSSAAFYGIFAAPVLFWWISGWPWAATIAAFCVVCWLLSAGISETFDAQMRGAITMYERAERFLERERELSKSESEL